MLGESHDLVDEFPDLRDRILRLRDQDTRFAELFDAYHRINDEVIRIEQGLETPSDVYTEELKKKRLLHKDRIYQILRT